MSGKSKSPYAALNIGYFDRNGVNVGYAYLGSSFTNSYKTFTTPLGCCWLVVCVINNESTPKPKETFTISNICLSLVHTGYRNGEYEEYKSYTRDLPIQEYFPDGGLKKAGEVYDEITETQAIKRIGVVEDLSTLAWGLGEYDLEDWGYEFYSFLTSLPNIAHQNGLPNIKLSVDTYTPIKHSDRKGKDLVICIENRKEGYGVLIIRDNRSGKDVNSLKNLLKGVSLYYELKNPEITTFTEPLNLNYEVSDFGTERVITSSFSTPLKADIVYGFNAVDTIRGNNIDIADIKTTLPVMSEKIDNEITRSQDFDNRITDDVFGAINVEDGTYNDVTGIKFDKDYRCRCSISIPIRQLQGVKITKNPEGCYTWLQLLDKDKKLLGTMPNLWRSSPADVNNITPVDFRNLAQPDTCFVNFVFKTHNQTSINASGEGPFSNEQKTICRDWLIDLLYQNKNIDNKIAESANLALRMIFTAHGALYNDTSEVIKRIAPWGTESFVDGQLVITYDIEIDHLPGHYYLNGIGDITEEEMLEIYVAGEVRPGGYCSSGKMSYRTNITKGYNGGGGTNINIGSLAMNNYVLKVVCLSNYNYPKGQCYVDGWINSFHSCPALEYILPNGVYYNTTSTPASPFNNTPNLKQVYIRWVQTDISFASSRYLSKGSVWTMIKYVKDNVTKNITLTLHPDVYNALVNDPDIISVLEETNARISGSISIATVSE